MPWNFADVHGIILKLQAASDKTRCFDVSWLSQFPQEEERLIMGSSLQICEIYVENKWTGFVPAIQVFEQIINGHFITGDKGAQSKLYALLSSTLNIDGSSKGISSPYIASLFEKMIQNCAFQLLWINHLELDKLKHKRLKSLLSESSFWDKIMNTKENNIYFTQQFQWNIADKKYFQYIIY